MHRMATRKKSRRQNKLVVDGDGGSPKRLSPTAEWHEFTNGSRQSYNSSNSIQIEDVDYASQNDSEADMGPRRVLLGIKAIIGFVLFVIVLVCTVLSKVTLVSMTGQLRSHMWAIANESGEDREDRGEAAVLYWQLLFVMMLPNFITFVRCFFFGVFGKTKKSFPWPKPGAVLWVCCA